MTDWQPSAPLAALRLRAEVNAEIRAFFAEHGVLEVETPLLSQFGTVDRHIESFAVDAGAGRAPRWLRTSPEFALKRLLAAGVGDCYELGRVFRFGEAGRRHNPEFTLLEWYRVGWDHYRLIGEVVALLQRLFARLGRRLEARRISYRQLFLDRLGIDPHTASDGELLAALPADIAEPQALERDDWLDLLFTHRLQGQFAANEILAVLDYPASQCALARLRHQGDVVVAERFEIYLGPMELANGYHELLDGEEQARRFADERAWREAHGRGGPAADAHLLAALRHGLPACAGVALGVDRLLAVLGGYPRIEQVVAFAFARA